MRTHKELVEIGYKWCLRRCGFAFKELVTIETETPDCIGFNSNGTFLIEAKTTRADFFKDQKKHFRYAPCLGVGDWRFYITEKGLIKIDELPDGWGLIEVNEYGRAKTTYNPFGKGNIYSNWVRREKNERAERSMMYSALRRLQEKKLIDNIYPKTL